MLSEPTTASLERDLLFALFDQAEPRLALEEFVEQLSELNAPARLTLAWHLAPESGSQAAPLRHAGGTAWLVHVQAPGQLVSGGLLTDTARFIQRVLDCVLPALDASVQTRSAQPSMIARELHDNVAQELGYLSFQASRLGRRLQDASKAAPLVEELKSGLTRLQRQVRELISQARLSMDGQTLREALAQVVAELSRRSGIAFHLDNRLADGTLPAALELQVLQILREGLSNAVRHARARNLWIELRCDAAGGLWVQLEDDGVGLGAAATQPVPGHYGLSIMLERAASVGAHLHIGPRAPNGTLLRLVCEPRAINRSEP